MGSACSGEMELSFGCSRGYVVYLGKTVSCLVFLEIKVGPSLQILKLKVEAFYFLFCFLLCDSVTVWNGLGIIHYLK